MTRRIDAAGPRDGFGRVDEGTIEDVLEEAGIGEDDLEERGIDPDDLTGDPEALEDLFVSAGIVT